MKELRGPAVLIAAMLLIVLVVILALICGFGPLGAARRAAGGRAPVKRAGRTLRAAWDPPRLASWAPPKGGVPVGPISWGPSSPPGPGTPTREEGGARACPPTGR